MASKVKISLNPMHSVGSPRKPYKMAESSAKRHAAIHAGIRYKMRSKPSINKKEAIKKIKGRLNVLRIYNKYTKYCPMLQADMKYIDKYYKTQGTTNDVCKKIRSKRRRS